MDAEYLSCSQTAKLIRTALKAAFPATVFSVRSKTYSGGAAIEIHWTDGPTDRLVSAISKPFQGGEMDGTIDMATTHSSWLQPDGKACKAIDQGTTRSRGSRPPEDNAMPLPGCRLVRFGADHVFTYRALSPAFAGRVLARVQGLYGNQAQLAVEVSKHDGSAYLTGDMHMERIGREIASRLVIMRG